ncbi:MAG: hypothetical protein RIC55_23785 [Pirellulaceae bacterium]
MFSRSSMTLVTAGLLTIASAFGQAPAAKADGPVAKAAPDDAALPQCLKDVALSQQQQDQVMQIVRDYDAAVASVWKQFGDRYLETVRTEALLLTAIEDNLTEAQRSHVRVQRRRTAQREKSLAGTDVKPNQAVTKPDSAVEEVIDIVGVTLTAEQEAAADRVQEKYLSHLRSLNRDILGLHTRLVSLEADKIVALENVLTKDQLEQLREIRQNASFGPKVVQKAGPTTTK